MISGRELRIGDTERDAAVRALGEHFAAGRLTKEEYDERSDLALRARTDSDLRPLFADLPRLKDQRGSVPAPKAAPTGRSWMWRSVPAAPLLAVLVLVVAVTSEAWWLLFAVWWLFFCARPRRRWR
jgi:Domain of unknown function (DUF1707)